MQFNKVINQEQAKNNLIKLYNSEKLPHALLFLGQPGVGGLPLAIAFAQYIFCENKTDHDSCGKCSACLKIEKLSHPDLHLTFPSIGATPNLSKNHLSSFREFFTQSPYAGVFEWLQYIGAENRQGNISSHECRDIIDRLNLTAFESGYKIQIIWRPEYLGKEGNILLKLIEEPPANTYIFLVAEEEGSILSTILSRTQKVALSPLHPKVIAQALVERTHISERQALQIANISNNSYHQATQHLVESGNSDWLPLLRNWLNALFSSKATLAVEWVDELAKAGREQQKHFLSFAQEIIAHAIRLTLAPAYEPPLVDAELELVKKLAAKKISIKNFEAISKAIEDTIYNIGRNAHSKTQLLGLTLQVQYLIKDYNLKSSIID